MYANGFLMMSVVILPFPTAVMAEYMNTPFQQPAIVFHCAFTFLHNIAWNVFLYGTEHPINVFADNADVKAVVTAKMATRGGFFIYLAVLILAWWYPVTALVITTLIWLVWVFLGNVVSDDDVKEDAAGKVG